MMRGALIEVPGTPPGVRAVFTTRRGGVSEGAFGSLNLGSTTGDAREAVRANRIAVATAAGFAPGRACMVAQVHGAAVVEVGHASGGGRFAGAMDAVAEADGLVTAAPGVALAVQAADCVPVLAWRNDGSRVLAIHAGWRGLVAGIVGTGAGALGESHAVHAVIGPCVGSCCYPVEAALRERMADLFGADVVQGSAVDLRSAARRALVAAGIRDDAIADVAGCTSCEGDQFFSYRRDGQTTGRHAGIIWIKEGP